MIFALDINPFDDLVGGVIEGAAEATLEAIVGFISGLIVSAIEAITNLLISAMNATSAISITGGSFDAVAGIRAQVLGLSMFLLLGFLFINVMKSVARGEPGNIIRALLVDLPTAVLYTTLFTSFLSISIDIVDAVSDELVGDVGQSVGQVGAMLAAGNTALPGVSNTVGGLLALLFALLYLFAAMLVWAELLIRSALIYIVIVAAPLGFAARASAGAQQIARRTIEVIAALVLSKLGIALAFGVGASIIDGSTNIGQSGETATEGDLTGMFVGVVVILLAAFMPWMILKMIPVMAAATDMGGAERAPFKAAAGAAGVGIAAVGAAKLAGSPGSGGGGSQGSDGGSSGDGGGPGTTAAQSARVTAAATRSGTNSGSNSGGGGAVDSLSGTESGTDASTSTETIVVSSPSPTPGQASVRTVTQQRPSAGPLGQPTRNGNDQ